ncbi:MAG: hypothetical protein AMS18_03330 [Gemmatimonas sp. SG8_17]|nr:MAG: hypothetical protein AMS18_03330 [Gemmatimonas sp. SG8_17]
MSRTDFLAVPALAVLLLVAGCGRSLLGPELIGTWGGEHILLTVAWDGATVEYDCAYGALAQPVVPDPGGNFDIPGTHVFEHGGPVREDEVPDEHPARYRGWTNGRRMTLSVTLTDTGQVIGPYELRFGRQALLFKCL